MSRPNETQIIAAILRELPSIEGHCIGFRELAARTGCSEEQVRKVMSDLLSCEADGASLDFVMLDSEDVERAIRRASQADAKSNNASNPGLVPILESMRGCGGIVCGPRGFGALSRPARLSPEESQALIMALERAGVSSSSPLADKLRRKAMPASAELEPEIVSFVRGRTSYETLRTLTMLCRQRRRARIRYAAEAYGAESERVIAPIRVFNGSNGELYLFAYCYLREGLRSFRADRIESLEPLAAHVDKALAAKLPYEGGVSTANGASGGVSGSGGGVSDGSDIGAVSDPPTALIELDEGESLDPRVWEGVRVVDALRDGRVLVELPIRNPDWLARHVAARFGRARVTSPPELARLTRDYVRILQAQMESAGA